MYAMENVHTNLGSWGDLNFFVKMYTVNIILRKSVCVGNVE